MNLLTATVKKAFRLVGYEILPAGKFARPDLDDLIDVFFTGLRVPESEFFFVQVGAYDGIFLDPIYRYINSRNVRGCFVEPQRKAFERLVTNYKNNEGLMFLNAAICHDNHKRSLYKVTPEMVEIYPNFGGCARFDYQSLLRNIQKGFNRLGINEEPEKYVEVEEVECITFSELLNRFDITRIDLLLIDAEGFDYEILKMVDFARITPKIVIYEHHHVMDADQQAANSLLKNHHYKSFVYSGDTFAIHTLL
ncbi:MAG: FkbM family methyltransferase [Chloroflexi bacterium]|nr:FkbM family methyltransferase [Chloroflexota bacterium]